VELKQETITAFNRYIVLTEEQARATLRETGSFLWIDGSPDAKREALDAQLRRGEIIIDRLETHDGQVRVDVPGGLLHHWVAMCFVPGVTMHETLRMLQDYERYPDIYRGDVRRSKLLSADGQRFNIFVQMYQKAIITVVYNAEFEVSYFRLGQSRSHSRSYSKRIVEVENPGGSDEGEKPIGRDRGFLWRLYSYWRLEERNGGIYVQLESIALSRRVPALFAWLVNPLLSSLPKTYLSRILVSTRSALTHGLSATASPRAVQERAGSNRPYEEPPVREKCSSQILAANRTRPGNFGGYFPSSACDAPEGCYPRPRKAVPPALCPELCRIRYLQVLASTSDKFPEIRARSDCAATA